jgi:hypothetical protein
MKSGWPASFRVEFRAFSYFPHGLHTSQLVAAKSLKSLSRNNFCCQNEGFATETSYDRIPVAPLLWVTSPSAADGSEFLQLLALFCRRSLLLSADSTAALWTLPMFLRPTLFLDGAELTARCKGFFMRPPARASTA